MSEAKVAASTAYSPSSIGAVIAIAQLTLTRFLRSKTLWVAAILAVIPLLPLLIGAREAKDPIQNWEKFIKIAAYMQLLVVSLLTAPAIAEEIEDKTYTYLWSRPIPRWTVLAGKLLIGGILGTAMMAISLGLGSQIAGLTDPVVIATGITAMTLGVITTGCIASCFGTLLPKHPLAISISYFMVLDLGISATPFSGARFSVMHNVIAISGFGPHANTVITSALWLLGLCVFWTGISLSRLSRKELSTGS